MTDLDLQSRIGDNLTIVRNRVADAARRVGRDPDEIEIVAVTKQKSAAVVKALLDNGVHFIGESYLKEALFKMEILQDYQPEWHMIGNIQRGKERQIAANFQVVHSVGRLETALGLNRYAATFGRTLTIFLELNVSGEDTKGGWTAARENEWPNILPEFEQILRMPSLHIKGLMTMAPYSAEPEDARPFFRRVKAVQDFLHRELPEWRAGGLSMGMSGDFEVAVEEGATVLRIGSALVGPRE